MTFNVCRVQTGIHGYDTVQALPYKAGKEFKSRKIKDGVSCI
jgi:hypothetical protein